MQRRQCFKVQVATAKESLQYTVADLVWLHEGTEGRLPLQIKVSSGVKILPQARLGNLCQLRCQAFGNDIQMVGDDVTMSMPNF